MFFLDIIKVNLIRSNIAKSNNTLSIFGQCKTNNEMDIEEVEKSKAFISIEIIEYVPNSIVIKTILKKSTGNISVMSVDSGEGLTEKTSPFDTFAQVIDGQAELVISGKSNILKVGQSIVIPAHAPNLIKPNGRFKMIVTVIKSGYE